MYFPKYIDNRRKNIINICYVKIFASFHLEPYDEAPCYLELFTGCPFGKHFCQIQFSHLPGAPKHLQGFILPHKELFFLPPVTRRNRPCTNFQAPLGGGVPSAAGFG